MVPGGARMVLETEHGRIAKKVGRNDNYSMADAMTDMRAVDEHELHATIIMLATRPEYQRAASLSQTELGRRSSVATRNLTIISIIGSGCIGILGVVLGALLTWYFGS